MVGLGCRRLIVGSMRGGRDVESFEGFVVGVGSFVVGVVGFVVDVMDIVDCIVDFDFVDVDSADFVDFAAPDSHCRNNCTDCYRCYYHCFHSPHWGTGYTDCSDCNSCHYLVTILSLSCHYLTIYH